MRMVAVAWLLVEQEEHGGSQPPSPGAPIPRSRGRTRPSRSGYLGPVNRSDSSVKPYSRTQIGSWWRCRPRRGSSADAGPSRPVDCGCSWVVVALRDMCSSRIGRGGVSRSGAQSQPWRPALLDCCDPCALIQVYTLSRPYRNGSLRRRLSVRAKRDRNRGVSQRHYGGARLRRVRWHRETGSGDVTGANYAEFWSISVALAASRRPPDGGTGRRFSRPGLPEGS